MQQELCTGLACAHKPGGLGCSPCPPEQSLPWLYFCREQCAIAKIVHEECCLPHSPRVKPGWVLKAAACLLAVLAQHPALPDQAYASLISASGCGYCSTQGCIAWLRTTLRCSGSCCMAQDLVARPRTMSCCLGLPCRAQDHIAFCSTVAGSMAEKAGTEPCMPPSTAA